MGRSCNLRLLSSCCVNTDWQIRVHTVQDLLLQDINMMFMLKSLDHAYVNHIVHNTCRLSNSCSAAVAHESMSCYLLLLSPALKHHVIVVTLCPVIGLAYVVFICLHFGCHVPKTTQVSLNKLNEGHLQCLGEKCSSRFSFYEFCITWKKL